MSIGDSFDMRWNCKDIISLQASLEVDGRTRLSDGWDMSLESVLDGIKAGSDRGIEILSFFNLTISAM
jgi:hypothetical protein